MIKIITSVAEPGGSTTAHVNLCNLFNERGLECKLYMHKDWHLSKCNGGMYNDFKTDENDIIISHNIEPQEFLHKPRRLHILSLHEKHVFPLKNFDLREYDAIHYVSQTQRNWHGVNYKGFICPNVIDSSLKANQKTVDYKSGGVIGSIDENKQTHVSIERALNDNCQRIHVFGTYDENTDYFKNFVKPLKDIHNERIIFHGFVDRQTMYDMVTDVYMSSRSETWCYVKVESILTNTTFHGTPDIEANFPNGSLTTKDEIFNIWKFWLSQNPKERIGEIMDIIPGLRIKLQNGKVSRIF